ncbi:MAG: hypothetical protein ACT4QE_06765 [Anaerolineales bacterium]
MTRRENVFSAIVKGAMAGMAGTTALTSAMKSAPPLLSRFGLKLDGKPAGIRGRIRSKREEPTEKLAARVAKDVLDTPIDQKTKQVAGQAIHWGYGAAWGAVYGVVQNRLHLPHQVHGLLFGGIVGLIGATIVPALGLTSRRTRQPMAQNVMPFLTHVLYGWVTARTFHSMTAQKK